MTTRSPYISQVVIIGTSSAHPRAPQMEQLDTRPYDREGDEGHLLLSENLQAAEQKGRKWRRGGLRR